MCSIRVLIGARVEANGVRVLGLGNHLMQLELESVDGWPNKPGIISLCRGPRCLVSSVIPFGIARKCPRSAKGRIRRITNKPHIIGLKVADTLWYDI